MWDLRQKLLSRGSNRSFETVDGFQRTRNQCLYLVALVSYMRQLSIMKRSIQKTGSTHFISDRSMGSHDATNTAIELRKPSRDMTFERDLPPRQEKVKE